METDPQSRTKRRAAALSVGSNTMLVLGKLVVGVYTGSVAVISEAVHSAMDLLASLIAFTAVSLSDRPPDEGHPHGHGKIEDLSGAVEALLIFGAVVFIGHEAIDKLMHGVNVHSLHLGVIVMGVSAAVNTVVSWYLYRVGRRTDSTALLADGAHLRTDVYTSLGVMVGLLLVHFTGRSWLDPAVALAVGLLIVWEAWQITRRSVGELLDRGLPEEERLLVEEVIRREGVGFHALRSRKSGSTRNIDLHLDVSPNATVDQIHALCDRIEAQVRQALPRTQVLIHPEPLLELDRTRTAQRLVEQILQSHGELFVGYGEIFIHEVEQAEQITICLHLDPALSVRALKRVTEHLTGHIHQHLPRARVCIHAEPAARGARSPTGPSRRRP